MAEPLPRMTHIFEDLVYPSYHRQYNPQLYLFIYLFGVLRHFQHCTGHITMASWKGRGNQYIKFFSVLYCKLPTNGKQLPAFPLEVVPRTNPRPQRWELRVLPLCHCGPFHSYTHWARHFSPSTTVRGLCAS